MSTKTDSQSVWMHVIGGATSSNRLDKRKTKFTKRILPLHIYSDFLRINFFPLCNRHTNEQADICTVRELTFSFFSRQLPTLYHSLLTKVPKPARSSQKIPQVQTYPVQLTIKYRSKSNRNHSKSPLRRLLRPSHEIFHRTGPVSSRSPPEPDKAKVSQPTATGTFNFISPRPATRTLDSKYHAAPASASTPDAMHCLRTQTMI